MTQRGLFIVFEGPDRAGKTTQAADLFNALLERDDLTESFRFPFYAGALGKELQRYLRRELNANARTAHLMFAANRADAIPSLEAALAAGHSTICDRYVYSGAAYSVAKGLDYAWCLAIEGDLPRPDLVIQLDADPAALAVRADFGAERHDDTAFLQSVRAAYRRLAETHHRWVVLDATRPRAELAAAILERVTALLAEPRASLQPIVAAHSPGSSLTE